MKKMFMLAAMAALLVCLTNVAHAKIRRVGYFGTPIANTDYTDLQSAHDAATTGDTLLIFPGSWSALYSKKLVTLGYGYFVDTASLGTAANPGLQNIKGTLNFSVTLAAGSSNSTFEGLDGFSVGGDANGTTLTGITVRRCNGYVTLYQNNIYTNWQILQCYLGYLYLNYYASGAVINNLTVANCYLSSLYGSGGTASNQSGQFTNCIFYSGNNFNNGSYIVKNSIFIYDHNGDANCVYQNNVFNSDYTAVTGNGNIGVTSTVMQNSLFVGYSTQGTYSNDSRYALAPGSPAIGAGAGGTNCGIYGGTNPYKLSGMPRIPAFYKLTAPSNITSTNPYTITFSVRSNN